MGDIKNNIAWHPGFVNAMKLELAYNEDELEYDTERELNQQPLRIDFLVIKKNRDTIIKNEIGRFFLKLMPKRLMESPQMISPFP